MFIAILVRYYSLTYLIVEYIIQDINNIFFDYIFLEASRGAGAQSVPVVGSILTRGGEILIYISSLWYRHKGAALSSATQHAMPSERHRNSGTECLNTRFPLRTMLCCGIQREAETKKILFPIRKYRYRGPRILRST